MSSVTEVLLKAGANPNTILRVRDRNLGCYIGSTAVVTAASKGFTEIVKLLIRSGASLHSRKHEDRPILIHQSDGSEACPASRFLAQRCNDAASLTSLFVLFSSGVVSLKAMSNILKVCGEGNACETKSDGEAREFFSIEAVSVMKKSWIVICSVQLPHVIIAAQNRCPMLHENHPIWRSFFGKKSLDSTSRSGKERESRISKQAASDESNFKACESTYSCELEQGSELFRRHVTEFDTGIVGGPWYDNGDVRKYDLSALTRTIRGERISHAGRFRLLRSELDIVIPSFRVVFEATNDYFFMDLFL